MLIGAPGGDEVLLVGRQDQRAVLRQTALRAEEASIVRVNEVTKLAGPVQLAVGKSRLTAPGRLRNGVEAIQQNPWPEAERLRGRDGRFPECAATRSRVRPIPATPIRFAESGPSRLRSRAHCEAESLGVEPARVARFVRVAAQARDRHPFLGSRHHRFPDTFVETVVTNSDRRVNRDHA